jgi:predicted CopG family antitoxin
MEYKRIIVTETNYRKLKRLGEAGDSFNDVITEMLKKIE